MASFQSKIGWKRPRKSENKNHRSVSFLPGANKKIKKKNSKKIQKIKKHIMDSSQAKIGWKMMRKSENKNYRSVPTRREIEIFKRIAKKFRKLKNTIMASFQSKIGWKRPRKIENKNHRSVSFLPCAK